LVRPSHRNRQWACGGVRHRRRWRTGVCVRTAAEFAARCVGYCLSGIPNLTGASGNGGWAIVGEIGGWFLVASSAAAAYTGLAYIVNSVWNTVQIPIGGEP
jgi:succinate-acetate transporter protein